jgi:hypothetical protein
MKHLIHIGEKPVVLIYSDFEDEIDVNELTRIHYENLWGEAVTVSTLLNRIGQLRAEAERIYDSKKFELNVLEADLKKRWRREANKSSGKFSITDDDGTVIFIKLTEKSLDDAVLCDKGYQTVKNNEIKVKRDYGYIDSLFWAIQSKDRKLNNLLPQVTPGEFYDELIEGSINGIFIKKPKK